MRQRHCTCMVVLAALTWLASACGCQTTWAGPGGDQDTARGNGGVTLRLLTHNIHHARGMDKKLDLERIARVIGQAKADLVALQEVDQRTQRTGGLDEPAELARLTGMHVSYGKAMDFDGGAYGVAVLSRWPIEQAQTHRLPGQAGREPRVALETQVRAGRDGPSVSFFCTHWDHQLSADRIRQARRLAELSQQAKGDLVVLAGDFNDSPASESVKHLLKTFEDAGAKKRPMLSCPADQPTIQIDHILYRSDRKVRAVDATVLDEAVASDHRPVLAVLEVAPKSAPAASPGPDPSGARTGGQFGRVTGCEHFAFLRARMSEGLGGPARQAAKSWHVSMCMGPDGAAYVLDAENCQVYRVAEGTVRLLAGDGIRGWRDGPADRARFDFGVGSYQDAAIACDNQGRIYVGEGLPGRLRRIARDERGRWQVTTLSGGGDRMPKRGQSIPAREMKFGCASRFALDTDGSVYFATYGGVYRVADAQGSLVASTEELAPRIGKSIHDWHVGGSHIADGWFYWMPGGGPNLYRLNVRTGQAERFAGVGKIVQGLDGPTLKETGFHTVFIVYTPDAKVMFTGGGDEGVIRKIEGGRAAHLQKDGTFLTGGRKTGWRLCSPLCVDKEGRLYTETGIYAWGGWVVQVRFADERRSEP